MTSIPLFKVLIAPDAAEAVAETLASGYIGQGPRVDAFEAAFGKAVSSPRPILTMNSCTSALDLALHLCGVGPGDAVISTPMTCTATNSPIATRGATILWADVDPVTGLIDPASVERVVRSRKPKAIMAVDWGGRRCDYQALKAFGVPVIEDAAHMGPAPLLWEYGDYVAWSFQAIKHLTTGDGGALMCPDTSTTYRARLLRWYGLDRTRGESFRCGQEIHEVGYKYHMNDLAAALGLANLELAQWAIAQQRKNAWALRATVTPSANVTLPPPDHDGSWWLYTVLVERQVEFEAFARERGITVSQVHARNDRHPAFRRVSVTPPGGLPGLEEFSRRQVAVPVGWWLTEAELGSVTQLLNDWS